MFVNLVLARKKSQIRKWGTTQATVAWGSKHDTLGYNLPLSHSSFTLALFFTETGSQHFWEVITVSLKLLNFISPVSPAILLCRLSFGSDKPAEQSTQLCKNQCQQNRGVVLGRPRNPEFRIYLNCNAWWIVS